MDKSPIRVTLRGALIALLVLFLWIGAWIALSRIRLKQPGMMAAAGVLFPLWIGLPFVAIGALLGRIWQGLVVGAFVVLAILLFMLPIAMH